MKLKIATNLELPVDAGSQKFAFLGRTGSGKTYAAQKLAEEMIAAGVQVVTIDPVGVWYGLRIAADGKERGIQIPVFGGLHGDVPLEPTGGALIADLIVDRGISAVIDVSQFESDTQKARFASDFAARLFYRKKASPSVLMLFLEECQEFIPENPQKADVMMLHHFTRMVKLGRNFGIGVGLISQRPQEVNKKCLNLTECMFAFQMRGPHERKTMHAWAQEKDAEDMVDLLPTLEVGQAHVSSPQWLRFSGTVKVLPKWTFNASSTPTVGASHKREPKPLESGDMERIRKDMAATIERAKADDPRELRKRIAELERQAKAAPVAVASKASPEALKKEFERGALSVKRHFAGAIKKFQKQFIDGAKAAIAGGFLEFEKAAPTIPGIEELFAEALSAEQAPVKRIPAPLPVRQPAERVAVYAPLKNSSNGSSTVSGMGRKILTVLAQYPQGMGMDRLAILAGSTVNGHFKNTLGGLRTSGYITPARVTPIQATEEGLIALGSWDPLPVGEDLRNYWVGRLGGGLGAKIFRVLIETFPQPLSLEKLAQRSDSTVNGHFNNTIGSLRTMGLMTPARTPIKASDYLFEE